MYVMAHRLAELQFKKPADNLCDVKELELVDLLAKMLAGKKRERHAANPG